LRRPRLPFLAVVTLVVAAGVTAGCSVVTGASYNATSVTSVQTTTFPDRSTVVQVSRGDPDWSAVESALPSHLPKPTTDSDCDQGYVTTITLKNGSTLSYGPCRRPKTIDALRCIAAGEEPGCA
jgi:hypothetical protein